MWKLPFIARSTFDAMEKGHSRMHSMKDEIIENLRSDLEKERERYAAREKELLDKVVDLMKPAPLPEPVDMRKRWKQREEEERKEFPEQSLDLTQVDENDNDAIAFLVSREVPQGTKVNGVQFLQSCKRLRDQIIAAKRERLSGYSTPGVIPVPTSVLQQIEEAESAGRAEAKAGA